MEALARIDAWPVEASAVGVTDAETTRATRGSTGGLPVASVTKLLTALSVLVTVQDDLLDLDEPAGPPGATVRHLLAHASGLPPDEDGRRAPVASRRIYSNLGFEVLGALVEERAEVRLAQHLRRRVLAPLGMRETELLGSPAHGAMSSCGDLLALGRELLAPSLLDPGLHAAATRVAFPDLDGVVPGFGRHRPNDWGLGPEIRGHKHPHWTGRDNDPGTVGHFGRSGAFLWADPAAGLACAFVGDLEFGPWAARSWPDLSDAVLAGAAG